MQEKMNEVKELYELTKTSEKHQREFWSKLHDLAYYMEEKEHREFVAKLFEIKIEGK